MTPKGQELVAAVRALPEKERTEVIETLVDEFDSGEFDADWVAEINRHSDEIEAGLVKGISWADLEKKLLLKCLDNN